MLAQWGNVILLDHMLVGGLDHLRGRFGQRAARHGDVLVGGRCCDWIDRSGSSLRVDS